MLGKQGGSVSYNYPLPAERGVLARMCVYPTVLHQVKMRMRGGWLLYAKQKGLRRKGEQFQKIMSELQGLDQTTWCGYLAEMTIRGNISIEAAKRIARETLVVPLPRGTVTYQVIAVHIFCKEEEEGDCSTPATCCPLPCVPYPQYY